MGPVPGLMTWRNYRKLFAPPPKGLPRRLKSNGTWDFPIPWEISKRPVSLASKAKLT